MTIKQCDRCGRTITTGNELQRYMIFDRCPETNVALARQIGSTLCPMDPLDLCPECYHKLLAFIKNEDVSRTYRAVEAAREE